MKGRSNYPCSFDPADSRDCAKGYCRRVEKASIIQKCLKFGTVEQAVKLELPPEAHACDYWAQLTRAQRASITIFNFHSFLFQQRLGRFGVRDFMVLDECHNAESVIMQFVQLVVSDDTLRKIDIRLDLSISTKEQLITWLDREQVEERIFEVLGSAANTEEAAEGFSPEETDQLRSLLDRITLLRKFLDMTEWVVDVTQEPDEDRPGDFTRKLRVRPVFINLFAKELLFSKASRVLAMSATILDAKIWARNLGIPLADIRYVEAPCTFPVRNRPIIPEYAGDMSWKNQELTLPKLYRTIAGILDRHRGQRGIIHAHSERLVRFICDNVRSPRFLNLEQYPLRDKTALLKDHSLRKDSVIVASGFHEGVDLKDDLARFAIIAKVPWPGMDDKLVKTRMALDGSYLPYQTALKLVQSYGRSCRHKDDWALTYVLDSNFDSFLSRCGWLVPGWFKEAIQRPQSNP